MYNCYLHYLIWGFLSSFAKPKQRVVVGIENDIPPVNRIDQIKAELAGLEGQRIRVKANMGRSRIVERTGTLMKAHPSLFVVEVEERRGRRSRQSYQYVDVLTGTVEIYDVTTGERLMDYSEEE